MQVYGGLEEYVAAHPSMEREGWHVASHTELAGGGIRIVWTRRRRYRRDR